MSALSTLIAAAVADAVSANPKLFDPKKLDRAPDILAKDIVRALTRPAKEGEVEAQAEAEAPAYEMALNDSAVAKAYVNLRRVAGCLAKPTLGSNGTIYVPREANNAAVLAFVDVPAVLEWQPVTAAQQTAWRNFFDRTLGAANRRPINDATVLPWPWPPSKEGKVYTATEEPAEQLDGLESP